MDTQEPLPTLIAPRLTLRAPRQDDAPALRDLVDDPGVARMTTGIPHPYSLEMAEAFLAHRTRANADGAAVFALDVPDAGFAGVLGFHPGPTGAWEAGYWLGRPHWGRGLMTEALRTALDWVGGAWGKRYLIAGHFADNPESGRVLIKAGFLYTGDVVPRYSAARGEEAPTRMMVWLA